MLSAFFYTQTEKLALVRPVTNMKLDKYALKAGRDQTVFEFIRVTIA